MVTGLINRDNPPMVTNSTKIDDTTEGGFLQPSRRSSNPTKSKEKRTQSNENGGDTQVLSVNPFDILRNRGKYDIGDTIYRGSRDTKMMHSNSNTKTN